MQSLVSLLEAVPVSGNGNVKTPSPLRVQLYRCRVELAFARAFALGRSKNLAPAVRDLCAAGKGTAVRRDVG